MEIFATDPGPTIGASPHEVKENLEMRRNADPPAIARLRDLRHNRQAVRKPILTIQIVFALMPFLAACSNPAAPVAARTAEGAAARQVTAVLVGEQPLERVITVTGTLAAEDQVALAFKVSGRVESVNIDLGSPVSQGQVLARLLPTDFEFRLHQAEAALHQARVRLGLPASGEEDQVDIESTGLLRQRRAVLQQARLNRDRIKTFFDRGLSSRGDLDAAEASLEVAEGQHQDAIEEIRNREGVLAQRRSELDLARQQLEDTILRSPINGAVRERAVTSGEYRTAGTPVLTIVRTDPLRLQLAVPERSAAQLRSGQAVRVRVEGDSRVYDGRLARLGAAIDEANRTLPVEAVVNNSSGSIRPGQFATADIVVAEGEMALLVPDDAVVSFAGVQRVLVVQDGKAKEQRIRTGRRERDQVEIVEGLRSGDVVIRTPGDLTDGAAVRVRTE
jgi:RND family efflux transporter MFP subunit